VSQCGHVLFGLGAGGGSVGGPDQPRPGMLQPASSRPDRGIVGAVGSRAACSLPPGCSRAGRRSPRWRCLALLWKMQAQWGFHDRSAIHARYSGVSFISSARSAASIRPGRVVDRRTTRLHRAVARCRPRAAARPRIGRHGSDRVVLLTGASGWRARRPPLPRGARTSR
jgi:hypothetical protein